MSATDKLVNSIIDAVDQRQNKKTSSYDTTAKVVRVEGNTAYVHIDGGVDETPASMDIMCHKGDTVQVRVGGGRAWITGNGTNPPTDDSTANYAVSTATGAYTAAKEAWDQADIAHEAAESAKVSAQEAKVSANEAKESAIEANNHANSALTQLSVVEDVVDTLNWITAHGIYIVTSDTEVVEGKYYFEATQVSSPSGNPREQNYFEYNSTTQKYVLTTDTTVTSGKTYYLIEQVTTTITDPTGYLELESVDEAMADYVQSHLALTDEGLYVLKDSQGYKILLANDGMYVYDDTGALVATYGSNITFSTTRPYTIGNATSYIKYLKENNQWKIKIVADQVEFTNGETVATGSDVSSAISTAAADATSKANNAKLYADNYITSISSNNGIQVHALNNPSSNYTQIDSDGMNVYKGGASVAVFGSASRMGLTTAKNIRIDTDGFAGYQGDTKVATFGFNESNGTLNVGLGIGAASSTGHAVVSVQKTSTQYRNRLSTNYSSSSNAYFDLLNTSSTGTSEWYLKGSNSGVASIDMSTSSGSDIINIKARQINLDTNLGNSTAVTITGTLNGFNIGGASGTRWNLIPVVNASGVLEVGKYIDFHETGTGTEDYTARLNCSSAGTLIASGAVQATNYYVGSHNSAIGTQIRDSLGTSKSLTANTWTELFSFSLPAGTWLVIAGFRCPSSSSGLRLANIEKTSKNSSQNASFTPSGNGVNSFVFSKCITVTATTPFYYNVMSTVASSASTGGIDSNGAGYGTFYQAIRIL